MGEIFEKAVIFALNAHRGQQRKGGEMYILHPLEDAAIVATMVDDEEVIAAAVLHDTVEDTPVTIDEIRQSFGDRIAQLVAHETENKRHELPASETWKIRKLESLEALKNGGIETKILWLGDKLSNMRALARDYEKLGNEVFQRFNQKDPAEQRWYHMTILDSIPELSDYPAYREYKRLINFVFNGGEL